MALLHPEFHTRSEGWLNRRGLLHAEEHAVRVITVSNYVARLIAEHTSIAVERISVIESGVPDAFRGPHDPAAIAEVCRRHGGDVGRYVIVVGTVSTRKNLAVLLRGLARMEPGLLGTPALLAAGPPGLGAGEIEAEADRLGLGDRVRFCGYVADDELPLLVAGAAVLAHPSRDEGFGLTPIEAMAAGTPVIASNAASLPEITGGAAILVDPEDPDAWAAALTSVLTDDEARNELVARGEKRQQLFRWDRTAAATRRVHDEVSGRR